MTEALVFPPSLIKWFGLISTDQHAAKMSSVLARAMPEVQEIARKLPNMTPRHVVDIGCGLGAKTMLLAMAYHIEHIYLLDGDGTKEHQGRFQEHTDAWASAILAQEFLAMNLSIDYKVNAINTNVWRQHPLPTDLIVSFRAWGHHFSVKEYLEFAWSSLEPGGHVILDIRRETDGKELMAKRGFKVLMQLDDPSKKCDRMVYTK